MPESPISAWLEEYTEDLFCATPRKRDGAQLAGCYRTFITEKNDYITINIFYRHPAKRQSTKSNTRARNMSPNKIQPNIVKNI